MRQFDMRIHASASIRRTKIIRMRLPRACQRIGCHKTKGPERGSSRRALVDKGVGDRGSKSYMLKNTQHQLKDSGSTKIDP